MTNKREEIARIDNILGMCSERSPRWRSVVLELEKLRDELDHDLLVIPAGEPPELSEDIAEVIFEEDKASGRIRGFGSFSELTSTYERIHQEYINRAKPYITKLLPWHNAEMERKGQETAREILKMYEDLGCVPEDDTPHYAFWQALKEQYGVKE